RDAQSTSRRVFFSRCTKDANGDPAEVAKNGGILLPNLLQSSSRTFSRGSFLSFFAFKEGILDTPISVLGGWATVSGGFSRHDERLSRPLGEPCHLHIWGTVCRILSGCWREIR